MDYRQTNVMAITLSTTSHVQGAHMMMAHNNDDVERAIPPLCRSIPATRRDRGRHEKKTGNQQDRSKISLNQRA
jgi:hypothetical protein